MCAAGPAAVPSPCSHADLAVGGGGGRVVKQADGQEEQVVASHYDDEACKGWREGSRRVRAREETLRIIRDVGCASQAAGQQLHLGRRAVVPRHAA